MEAEDPLSQLRDIHLPEPVSLWPPAPGWWLLLLLALVGLAFAYRKAIAAMIRRRKLASVLKELDQAWTDYTEQAAFDDKRNQAGLHFLAAVNHMLKRVALVMYPDSGSANLTGRDWLEYLDACDGDSTFRSGAGSVLADGLYRPRFDADAEALYGAARQWIVNRYREKHGTARQRTEPGSVIA